jgi:tetratricopeptide (TPR) repeat protein
MGHHEECLKASTNALNLDPSSVQVWQDRGLALYSLGAYKKALDSFNQALALDPRLSMLWNNRASTLHQLQRYEESFVSCYCAIKLDAENEWAWSNLGTNFHCLGYLKEAMASYSRALAINPRDPGTWHNRANLLKDLGRYEEAIANFDQTLAFAPQAFITWDNRGAAIQYMSVYSPINPNIFAQSIDSEYFKDLDRSSIGPVDSYQADKALEDFLSSIQNSRKQLLYELDQLSSQELIDFLQEDLDLDEFEELFEMPLNLDISSIMAGTIPSKVLQEISKDAFLQPGRLKPEIQVGGYQGALNSYSSELGENSRDTPEKAI